MFYSDAIVVGSSVEKNSVKIHFFDHGSPNQNIRFRNSSWSQTQNRDGTVAVKAIEHGVEVFAIEGQGGEITRFDVLGQPRGVTENNIHIAGNALTLFRQDIRDRKPTRFAIDIGQYAGQYGYSSLEDFKKRSVAMTETMAKRPDVAPNFPVLNR